MRSEFITGFIKTAIDLRGISTRAVPNRAASMGAPNRKVPMDMNPIGDRYLEQMAYRDANLQNSPYFSGRNAPPDPFQKNTKGSISIPPEPLPFGLSHTSRQSYTGHLRSNMNKALTNLKSGRPLSALMRSVHGFLPFNSTTPQWWGL